MEKLVSICNNIIMPIRDPNAQAASFLMQIFYKNFFKTPKGAINSSDFLYLVSILDCPSIGSASELALLDETINPAYIATCLKKSLSDLVLPNDYFIVYQAVIAEAIRCLDILYSNLEFFLDHNIVSGVYSKNIIIIDTDLLMKNQEVILKLAIGRLEGVTYSHNDMFNWSKSCGDNYHSGHPKSSQTNTWSAPARNSTRLCEDNDSLTKQHPVQDFPYNLQALLEKANKIHTKCSKQPGLVQAPSSVIKMFGRGNKLFSGEGDLLYSTPDKLRSNTVPYSPSFLIKNSLFKSSSAFSMYKANVDEKKQRDFSPSRGSI